MRSLFAVISLFLVLPALSCSGGEGDNDPWATGEGKGAAPKTEGFGQEDFQESFQSNAMILVAFWADGLPPGAYYSRCKLRIHPTTYWAGPLSHVCKLPPVPVR